MAKTRRFKTPAGQQSTAPNEDAKFQPTAPGGTTLAQEPAELGYAAFCAAMEFKDKDGNRLKRWHELSVYDRAGWRAASTIFRTLTLGGQHITIPKPQPGQVTLAVGDGNAYAVLAVERGTLQHDLGMQQNLAHLDVYIDGMYEENPRMSRPTESKEGEDGHNGTDGTSESGSAEASEGT